MLGIRPAWGQILSPNTFSGLFLVIRSHLLDAEVEKAEVFLRRSVGVQADVVHFAISCLYASCIMTMYEQSPRGLNA